MDLKDICAFECDYCLGTTQGSALEVHSEGWATHSFSGRVSARRGAIVLCPSCERRCQVIWKQRKKAA